MELPFGTSLIHGPRFSLVVPMIITLSNSEDGFSTESVSRYVFQLQRRWPLLQANKFLCVPLRKKEFFTSQRGIFFYLKTKANNEAGSSDLIISSLQALSAHLWRSIVRHSGMSREEETHCKLAVDFRQRLNPPLEKECFGNVIHLGVAMVAVGELLDNHMGWAALQINKTVRSQTDEKFCKELGQKCKDIKNR
ncbi:hypothetical protein N665_0138s0016 [Sinapis alba]|nr:hypothetical protein N665_0138s0016 [Sinapis alba]